MKIKASARDFGRIGDIDELRQKLGEPGGVSELPTYYYDYRRLCLPLTADEVSSEFGKNIKLFETNESAQNNRQTNAETGAGVNEGFLACGAGVLAFGEGFSFSTYGVHVSTDAIGTSVPSLSTVPDVEKDCYCGAVNLLTATAPNAMASLWWGGPTWMFIEKFFQAYRLQININRRFQILDESLLDLGMTPVPPKFIGASDSTIQPMPFIRATNDILAAKGETVRFLPPNKLTGVIPPNTTEGNELGTLTETPISPPLVGVTYGHPWIAGASNKLYCFNNPILFVPGMRFDISFVNIEDASVYEALTNNITIGCLQPVAGVDGAVTGEGGLGDNAATTCVVPGGCVSLGTVFKGVGLQSQTCIQYLLGHYSGGVYKEMYQSLGVLQQLTRSPEVQQTLRGQLAGWLKGE